MAAQLQLREKLRPLLLDKVTETSKELGRGSYGVVIEVMVNERQCAGKKLYDFLAQDNSIYLSKFGDEIILHSQQEHPNIVQLLGVHYAPGSRLPTLVMEYIPHSLSQLLEKKVPLEADSILLDVANGLNYLHQKQPPIIHRDLSANNVLLTTEHKAKIADLGVSKLADANAMKQKLTTAPGTTCMMPPEALQRYPVYDHTLDVFSFGCLILHVLTDQIPVPTDRFVPKPNDPNSFSEVSEWDRRGFYIDQISSHEFLSIIRKCLNNEPSGRPNITEVIKELQDYQHIKEDQPKDTPDAKEPSNNEEDQPKNTSDTKKPSNNEEDQPKNTSNTKKPSNNEEDQPKDTSETKKPSNNEEDQPKDTSETKKPSNNEEDQPKDKTVNKEPKPENKLRDSHA